jgi:hypothetical protein
VRYAVLACIALAACSKKHADPPKPPPPPPPKAEQVEFDRDEDAFEVVLKTDPAVLAIGEAHAQRGATAASSAKRFTDELLPLLAGRASDLLVELMMPPKGCVKQSEKMRQTQKPVVSQQAPTNQNEYVAMGEAARKLGIVPDLLRPSCEDLASINAAGPDAADGSAAGGTSQTAKIERSLETIARLTTAQATKMLARAGRKMVVTYGGALHNDAQPPAERAAWSYGPALSKAAGGRYVELDLYVPDFITDEDTWKKQPWYPKWQEHRASGKAVLVELTPKDYVLVLARK